MKTHMKILTFFLVIFVISLSSSCESSDNKQVKASNINTAEAVAPTSQNTEQSIDMATETPIIEDEQLGTKDNLITADKMDSIEYFKKGSLMNMRYSIGTDINKIIKEIGSPDNKAIDQGATFYIFENEVYLTILGEDNVVGISLNNETKIGTEICPGIKIGMNYKDIYKILGNPSKEYIDTELDNHRITKYDIQTNSKETKLILSLYSKVEDSKVYSVNLLEK